MSEVPSLALAHRTVGRAKPPARHFDVAQVPRGVPAVRLSAGNGASFSAFRQPTRVRLLPALRFGSGGTCCSGGVAAGIDFALRVAAEAFGPELAKPIQLGIEYDPHPPFDSGWPENADPALVAKVRAGAAQRQSERQSAVDRAAARL